MHAAMQNDAVSILAAVSRAGQEWSLHADMQMMQHLKLAYAADLSLVSALHRRAPYNRKWREYKEIKVCLGIEEMRVEELLLEAITLITFPQTSTSVEWSGLRRQYIRGARWMMRSFAILLVSQTCWSSGHYLPDDWRK